MALAGKSATTCLVRCTRRGERESSKEKMMGEERDKEGRGEMNKHEGRYNCSDTNSACTFLLRIK